jgi:glycosyltransferase involved in cell wall biosynthesis
MTRLKPNLYFSDEIIDILSLTRINFQFGGNIIESQKIELSVVLPCYNENENLRSLIDSYLLALGTRQNVEVIFVDNGSSDNSHKLLIELLAIKNDPRLKMIKVEVNQGYGFGILSGLRACKGQFLSWSHADQQCAPEDVFRIFDLLKKSQNPQKSFGKGLRVNDRGRAALLTQIQEFLSKIILGQIMIEINAQPKVFHRNLFESFRMPPNGYELDVYAYYKAIINKYDIVSENVIFHDRKHGHSKWAYSLPSKLKQIFRNFKYLIFLRTHREQL